MAKEARFPSDANKPKSSAKSGPEAAIEAAKQSSKLAEMPSVPPVEGVPQDLVKVKFNDDRHHLLDHVWALKKGINHLPKAIWEKAKAHPSIQSMLKSKMIEEQGSKPVVESDPAPVADE